MADSFKKWIIGYPPEARGARSHPGHEPAPLRSEPRPPLVRGSLRGARRGPGALAGPSRARIAYAVEGEARFLSHLDIVRLFDRLQRRVALPVEYSQGVSPHPRISFGPPRAVGMSSLAEYVDIAFTGPFTEERQEALRRVLPPGMRITRVMPLYGPRVSLESEVNCGAYRVGLADAIGWTPLLVALEGGAELPRGAVPPWLGERAAAFARNRDARLRRVTPKKVQEVDLGATLLDHAWEITEEGGVSLAILVAHGGRGRARPSEVAAAILGIAPEEAGLLRIERTGLYWKEPSGSLRDPFGDRFEAPWRAAAEAPSETRRET